MMKNWGTFPRILAGRRLQEVESGQKEKFSMYSFQVREQFIEEMSNSGFGSADLLYKIETFILSQSTSTEILRSIKSAMNPSTKRQKTIQTNWKDTIALQRKHVWRGKRRMGLTSRISRPQGIHLGCCGQAGCACGGFHGGYLGGSAKW